MDDYILELLALQGQPGEPGTEGIRIPVAGGMGETRGKATAGEYAEGSMSPARLRRQENRQRQGWIGRLMAGMEPVYSGFAPGDGRAAIMGTDSAQVVYPRMSGDSCTGSDRPAMTPESMSMFFQRDARRYS